MSSKHTGSAVLSGLEGWLRVAAALAFSLVAMSGVSSLVVACRLPIVAASHVEHEL